MLVDSHNRASFKQKIKYKKLSRNGFRKPFYVGSATTFETDFKKVYMHI